MISILALDARPLRRLSRRQRRSRRAQRARRGVARGAPAGGDGRDRCGGLSQRHDHSGRARSRSRRRRASSARRCARRSRSCACANSESVVSDYVTASVAAVTGQVKRAVDRVHLLTQAISRVQDAAGCRRRSRPGADASRSLFGSDCGLWSIAANAAPLVWMG